MACQCNLMDEISTEDYGNTFCGCGRALSRRVEINSDWCVVIPTSSTAYLAYFSLDDGRDYFKPGVHAEMREDLGGWMRECRASAPATARE